MSAKLREGETHLEGLVAIPKGKQEHTMTVADDDLLHGLSIKLVNARMEAKETKDFSEVDRLKKGLIDAGVEVQMTKDQVLLKLTDQFDPSQLGALK